MSYTVPTIPTLEAIPTPPSLAKPKTFDVDAEAYLFAQRNVFIEMNNIISVLNPVAAAVMQHSQTVADNLATVQSLASQVTLDKNTVTTKASEVESARAQVATNRQTVASDKSTVQSLKNSTQTLANQVTADKNTVQSKASEVESARAQVATNQQTVASDKSTVQNLKNATQTLANQVSSDKTTVINKAAEVATNAQTVLDKAAQVESDRERAEAAADSIDPDTFQSDTLRFKRSYNLPASTDLNTITVGGFYDGSELINAPKDSVEWFYVIVQRHANSNGYCMQQAYRLNNNSSGEIYYRLQTAGNWGDWIKVFNSANDGINSGIDADKLDGLNASQFVRLRVDGPNSLGDSSWVVGYASTNNVDHVWYDEANNQFNFCADTTYRALANAKVAAGLFYENGEPLSNKYLELSATAANSSKLSSMGVSATDSANTIPQRNGSGDITARLFRATYQNDSAMGATDAIAFRRSTTDNYTRFCDNKASVRGWLETYSKAEVESLAEDKQEILVSGSTIRTINGNSLLGSGNLTISSVPSMFGAVGTVTIAYVYVASGLSVNPGTVYSGSSLYYASPSYTHPTSLNMEIDTGYGYMRYSGGSNPSGLSGSWRLLTGFKRSDSGAAGYFAGLFLRIS